MSIQQTKRQSDLEKRLQILRRQVYGRAEDKKRDVRNAKVEKEIGSESRKIPLQHPTSNFESFRTDISYLHQDLLKILLFSSLAIGIQVILFILSKNHILNLNFF